MTATDGSYHVHMLDPMPESEVAFAQNLLPETGFIVTAPAQDASAPSPELLATADALVTRTQPVTAGILAASPNVKIVQKYGGRPDRLDLDAARDAGVAVAVMPLRGCIAVAELTMTLILALSKQLIEAHRATASGAYRDLGLEPTQSSQRVHAFTEMTRVATVFWARPRPRCQSIQSRTSSA